MLGLIGYGNMANAITQGILKNGVMKAEEIIASGKDENSLKQAKETLGIQITDDNMEVIAKADVILFSVKPQVLPAVIEEIKDKLDEKKLLISIVAGKSIAFYRESFGRDVKLVRVMPNTPALVGEGCSGICTSALVSEQEKAFALQIFNSLGLAIEVPESQMDIVVGVSGSSPAYVFMFMEAMADAAVVAGMPRKQAYQFVAQAVMGSAKLMLETGKHPGELKDMVCSPAGTTIEAVKVLEEKGFRGAVMDATLSCIEKSRSL